LPSGCDAMASDPFVGFQEVVLLAPEHAGQRLPHHIGFIVADLGRCDRSIELVGLAQARFKYLVEPGEWIVQLSGFERRQPQPHSSRSPSPNAQLMMCSCLGACTR